MPPSLLALARALAPRPLSRAAAAFSSSASAAADHAPSTTDDPLRVELNRLLYRARQRGVLELDIIVGRWADAHVGGLDGAGRAALADVLSVETPDLLAALLGRGPPPPGMEANPAYAALAAEVAGRLARATARSAPGAAWVDAWRELKEEGNQ